MKYWVFDLDGTLVNSLTQHFEILDFVFTKYGQNFNTEEQSRVLYLSGLQFPKYLEEKFGSYGAQVLADFNAINDVRTPTIRLYQDMQTALDLLQSKNCPIAIWTARDKRTTLEILKHNNLHPLLNYFVTADCVTNSKPNTEGLEKIINFFKCSPDEIVMVGDHSNDMIPAHRLGAYPVRVRWNEDLNQTPCDLAKQKFNRVEDFKNWINRII